MRKVTGIYRKIGLAAAVGLGALAVISGAAADKQTEKITAEDFVMDTVAQETLYTTGEDINAGVIGSIREVEENILSWTVDSSEVSRLNAADGAATEVSDELASYLAKAKQLSEDSGGAFDPTIGKIIRLWDIDGENPHVPEQSELDALLAQVGADKIELEGNTVTLKDGCTLELGAVGKGIGCDIAAAFLEEKTGICGMLLSLGGSSVMTFGEKPDGSAWRVAVTDPRDTEGDYLGIVTLKGGQFLSTSGDYEKYFIEDGKRYHHILDPKTGYPVWNGLTSVTVVCEDGFLADGLSTACFVLGIDQSKELLEKYNAEALFVNEEKEVYVTDGIRNQFELTKDGYTLIEE